MSIDLDALEALCKTHLVQCGPHDFGLVEHGCTCPQGDPRPVISQLVELLAEVRTLREQLADEERAMEEVLTERDNLRDVADALAEHISKLTGVDIGEHSNANNPWGNALNAQPRKDGQ